MIKVWGPESSWSSYFLSFEPLLPTKTAPKKNQVISETTKSHKMSSGCGGERRYGKGKKIYLFALRIQGLIMGPCTDPHI